MKLYKCDNTECENKSKEADKWITIGSKKGTDLLIENKVKERNVISLTNYSDIHFCSKQCLINYFFVK